MRELQNLFFLVGRLQMNDNIFAGNGVNLVELLISQWIPYQKI